jgi:predicted anti-sigma-YlaC factor YlaD
VRSQFLAVVATALTGVIAVALLRGRISVDVAAIRALAVLGVVIVADRLLMPWVQLAVGERTKQQPLAKEPREAPADDR